MIINYLKSKYPTKYKEVNQVTELPDQNYLVYILVYDASPIVLGHGKINRAKVIFDDINKTTPNHIKALFVRLYHLYGEKSFIRHIVTCDSKEEAKRIEAELHRKFGGNKRALTDNIKNKLFDSLEYGSLSWLLINIALRSSFDGLNDLKKWKADDLIPEKDWEIIKNKLKL